MAGTDEDRYKPNWLSTDLRASQGESWPVLADLIHSRGGREYDEPVRDDKATLRRIGWLDQRGRVWQEIPPGTKAEEMRCGSFTPLLIDVRGDD